MHVLQKSRENGVDGVEATPPTRTIFSPRPHPPNSLPGDFAPILDRKSVSLSEGIAQRQHDIAYRRAHRLCIACARRVKKKKRSMDHPLTGRSKTRVEVRCVESQNLRGVVLRLLKYRGASLIRNSAPPGPYSKTMPRALWWSYGGLLFLMSEVPLFGPCHRCAAS